MTGIWTKLAYNWPIIKTAVYLMMSINTTKTELLTIQVPSHHTSKSTFTIATCCTNYQIY